MTQYDLDLVLEVPFDLDVVMRKAIVLTKYDLDIVHLNQYDLNVALAVGELLTFPFLVGYRCSAKVTAATRFKATARRIDTTPLA